jgi:hypothetical protein
MLPRLLILGAALLAGCATLPSARPPPVTASTTSAETVQAELLARYVRAQQTVVQGSLTEQAEILDEARRGFEQARQGPAALFYAMLLAAVHPNRDLQAALRLLIETRAHPELFSPVERALAIVETARVEQELGLATDNARLVADQQERERERQRNAPSSTAALTRQLKAETDENARLRKELEEAKAKLEAIANIDRSIPARPPANEGRKP